MPGLQWKTEGYGGGQHSPIQGVPATPMSEVWSRLVCLVTYSAQSYIGNRGRLPFEAGSFEGGRRPYNDVRTEAERKEFKSSCQRTSTLSSK